MTNTKQNLNSKKDKNKRTSITISIETRNKLMELKYEWGLKTLEDVIIRLISEYYKHKS